jgi:3-methyladenine DNA glycosylase AlkD
VRPKSTRDACAPRAWLVSINRPVTLNQFSQVAQSERSDSLGPHASRVLFGRTEGATFPAYDCVLMKPNHIQQQLRELAHSEQAAFAQRYFKTGPGEYAEGDIFLGIRVPVLRRIAAEHRTATGAETRQLLRSPNHEERAVALMIMVHQFAKGDDAVRRALYESYLSYTRFINNWDLVDCSAAQIVGAYLENRSRRPLYHLARSASLWERRISIIATFHFIRQNDFDDSLKLAERLLSDREDLIHKAVGWMLREIGKRHVVALEGFLHLHCGRMPRTALRYAIERFPESARQQYLKGTV